MYWCFTPFYGQVVFHHVERPQFISLLISWWYSDCFHSPVIPDNAYKNIHEWVLVGHMFLVTLTFLLLGLYQTVPQRGSLFQLLSLALLYPGRPLFLCELLPVAVLVGVSGSSLYFMCLLVIVYVLWRKWQPTPVFLPGKSHGWKSL